MAVKKVKDNSKMNITRKIQLIPYISDEKVIKEIGKKIYNKMTDEEKQKKFKEIKDRLFRETYKFISDGQYAQYLAMNRGMSYMVQSYYNNDKNCNNENFKKDRNDVVSSKFHIYDGINFATGVDTQSLFTQKIKQDFSTSLKNGLAKGERAITNYKKTNPLRTRNRHLKFQDGVKIEYVNKNGKKVISENIIVDWVNGKSFVCVLNDKKNCIELQHTLRKAITGEYKICDSSIMFNNKRQIILNLSLSVPKSKTTVVEGRTLGVDVGLAIPAYICVSDDILAKKGLGTYEEFARVRQQFKARRRRLQHQMQLVEGGKGRKKKLRGMDYLAEKEKNFAKTYNHQLSKKIIDFAIQNQCEYINLEKINSRTLDDRLLGQWGYAQLQQQIKYKAELVGLKIRFVKSAYTSQRCSCCGHIDKENRPKKERGQSYFSCTNPKCPTKGKVVNADWNASINIARSKEYIKENDNSIEEVEIEFQEVI